MVAVQYLTVEEVADRYQVSPRSIHEKTRTGSIPHMRRAGFRRCLFDPVELNRWDRGYDLETVQLADGGRIVRTKDGAL